MYDLQIFFFPTVIALLLAPATVADWQLAERWNVYVGQSPPPERRWQNIEQWRFTLNTFELPPPNWYVVDRWQYTITAHTGGYTPDNYPDWIDVAYSGRIIIQHCGQNALLIIPLSDVGLSADNFGFMLAENLAGVQRRIPWTLLYNYRWKNKTDNCIAVWVTPGASLVIYCNGMENSGYVAPENYIPNYPIYAGLNVRHYPYANYELENENIQWSGSVGTGNITLSGGDNVFWGAYVTDTWQKPTCPYRRVYQFPQFVSDKVIVLNIDIRDWANTLPHWYTTQKAKWWYEYKGNGNYTVYVRFTGNKLYAYYGGENAEIGNPADVFLLFEDFAQDNVIPQGWSIYGSPAPHLKIENGVFVLTTTASVDQRFEYFQAFGENYENLVMETRVKALSKRYLTFGLRQGYGTQYENALAVGYDIYWYLWIRDNQGSHGTQLSNFVSEWQTVKIIRKPSEVSVLYGNYEILASRTAQPPLRPSFTVYLHTFDGVTSIYCDYVRVYTAYLGGYTVITENRPDDYRYWHIYVRSMGPCYVETNTWSVWNTPDKQYLYYMDNNYILPYPNQIAHIQIWCTDNMHVLADNGTHTAYIVLPPTPISHVRIMKGNVQTSTTVTTVLISPCYVSRQDNLENDVWLYAGRMYQAVRGYIDGYQTIAQTYRWRLAERWSYHVRTRLPELVEAWEIPVEVEPTWYQLPPGTGFKYPIFLVPLLVFSIPAMLLGYQFRNKWAVIIGVILGAILLPFTGMPIWVSILILISVVVIWMYVT